MKISLIPVMLCINDPNNGLGEGRVRAIEVGSRERGDLFLSFETDDPGPVCRLRFEDSTAVRVRISRHEYPIEAYRQWVGNWCWDCVLMRPRAVARLLNDLYAAQRWTLDEGFTEWWEYWQSGQRVDEAQVMRGHVHSPRTPCPMQPVAKEG